MPPKFYRKSKFTKKENTEKGLSRSFDAVYLVIVESPSKCKKIEEYLGEKYQCIASKGHITNIENMKAIDTKNQFKTTYTVLNEKTRHVENMKHIISLYPKQNIILATDDDREGEAIAWHICQIFDLPVETTPRILFHEITKPALLAAIAEPTVINLQIVQSQQARQILDMLVGFKISPLLWKHLYNDKTNSLSAGRCQTPALSLVYENDVLCKTNSIGDMKPRYKMIGRFFNKSIPFILSREIESESAVIQFLKDSQTFQHVLSIEPAKNGTQSPPKPFNTSKLLQAASTQLHYSPKDTMSLCQKLYQSGKITYMRTDSMTYSTPFLNSAKQYIVKEWSESFLGNMILDSRERVGGHAHEAIRVTNIFAKSLTEDTDNDSRLKTLYNFIWKNTVESCMANYKYQTTAIHITSPIEKAHYHYSVQTPLFLGWKSLSEKHTLESLQSAANRDIHYFTLYRQGGLPPPVVPIDIESQYIVEHTYSHYTEATLIQKLEELGIGRPSTYSSIVETIKDRGYVIKQDVEGQIIKITDYKMIYNNGGDTPITTIHREKRAGAEKNKLILQPIGQMCHQFLYKHFSDFFSYDYTSVMEAQLDKIASCSQSEHIQWYQICQECLDNLKQLIKPVAKISKQEYRIDDLHSIVLMKNGPIIKKRTLSTNGEEASKPEYYTIKKEITVDLEKLEKGLITYELADLLEIKTESLGNYENMELFLRNGKYGPYVEWGDNRENITLIKKPLDKITMEDILSFLEKKEEMNPKILRKLNTEMSVRKGRFGPYIYYQRVDMKKPQFLNIKKFPEGFSVCDPNVLIEWVYQKYNIPRTIV
jgi:DNA topoisomerase-1